MVMASCSTNKEEMNESEEDALLQSDDDCDDAQPPKNFVMDKTSAFKIHDDSNITCNDTDNENDSYEMDDKDSSGDEDIQKLNEFEALLKELDSDKYAYDKYVRLCDLSHATDDLDNIRKAYSRFSEVYPLAAELWQRYINVELTISQTPKELEMIESLFRKALDDYYSCDLAKQFVFIATRCKDPRTIWNEIISVYGLDCMKGNEFFQLYREYLNCEEKKNGKDVKSLYIQSFLTQLQYPLYQMEETFIEFKVLYEKNKEQLCHTIKWDNVEKQYFRAKEQLQIILPYEDKLKALNKNAYRDRASVYFEYIKAAEKIFINDNILQVIHERMVADCCLDSECWLQYIHFMEVRNKPENENETSSIFKQDALDISKKALRNCSWSADLYIKRMLMLESANETKEKVQECLENALSAGFQTPEPAVQVWLAYLTYLRRQTNWQNEDECEVLRKNFNLAWTLLGQQWGVLADCNCEILQFWGRLEYGPLMTPKKGKELWTTVMESADNATKSGLWIEFIFLEMRCDLDATRKLFSKALHAKDLDNPSVISSAWERFERCNGTIKSLEKCLKECCLLMTTTNQHIDTKYKQNKQKNVKLTKKDEVEKTLKRKSSPASRSSPLKLRKSLETTPAVHQSLKHTYKDHENQTINEETDRLRIFLSNLDYNITEDGIRSGLPDLKIVTLELIRSANGRSRGFGYAQLETEVDVEKALLLDRTILCGRPLFISSVLRDKQQRQKFKYSVDVEPRKLFIKSLPSDITQKELEELFGTYGKLKDVRLVHHKSGKFKNIAYIEYENETSAKQALNADKMNLRGHIISVAISSPPPKHLVDTNPAKVLDTSSKLQKKPKLSLIPSIVRKNQTNKAQLTETPQQNGSQMTNEDFRKLLKK